MKKFAFIVVATFSMISVSSSAFASTAKVNLTSEAHVCNITGACVIDDASGNAQIVSGNECSKAHSKNPISSPAVYSASVSKSSANQSL